MKILVVEDEVQLADTLAEILKRNKYSVDTVFDGDDGLEYARTGIYDCILLDIMLPVRSGTEIVQILRREKNATPIMLLTAKSEVEDKIHGLDCGADDYLTKPFEFPELVARLRALGRRSQPARTPVLEAHGVRLDPFRREVYRDGHFIHLSPKEFAVLQVLMEAEGGVLSAETLLEKAWDANADPFTNSTRVTISHLRRKLGEPRVIQTVPGAGYRFSA